jgi:hypothetical protein
VFKHPAPNIINFKGEKEGAMKNLLALAVLIAMGVSFVAAVIALFSGEFLGALGLFVLTAVLNGVAKGLNA